MGTQRAVGEVPSAENAARAPGDGVGAVVIGRNEGERLIRCITSLRDRCCRIVYVDSGSTDGSVAKAVDLGAEVVQLDLQRPFTAARARNAGFWRLRELNDGDCYVQFVDGDCEVIDGWIEAAHEFLTKHNEIVAVCGRRMERKPNSSIYNAMCHREWNTPVGAAEAFGGDFMIRGNAFAQVHGFSEDQVAHEEPELCGRLRAAGFRIWRLDKPMTIHDAGIFRLNQYYRRNRRAGFGITQALLKSGWDIDPGGKTILKRSLTWSFLPPSMCAIGLAIWGPVGFVALAAYPAQVLRHALVNQQGAGGSISHRVAVASLAMIGKFGEAHGSIEFLAKNFAGMRLKAIYYK